jgi:hypothetical protein
LVDLDLLAEKLGGRHAVVSEHYRCRTARVYRPAAFAMAQKYCRKSRLRRTEIGLRRKRTPFRQYRGFACAAQYHWRSPTMVCDGWLLAVANSNTT